MPGGKVTDLMRQRGCQLGFAIQILQESGGDIKEAAWQRRRVECGRLDDLDRYGRLQIGIDCDLLCDPVYIFI